MPAIVVRNLPDSVHDALRRVAAERRQPVEALVREMLGEFARKSRGGIDFEKLTKDRAALGLLEDGPDVTEILNDPALSRRVLGLEMPRRAPRVAARTRRPTR